MKIEVIGSTEMKLTDVGYVFQSMKHDEYRGRVFAMDVYNFEYFHPETPRKLVFMWLLSDEDEEILEQEDRNTWEFHKIISREEALKIMRNKSAYRPSRVGQAIWDELGEDKTEGIYGHQHWTYFLPE